MNNHKKFIALFLILLTIPIFAQDDDDEYITFNDRRNVVHGIYVGIGLGYGEIKGKETYLGSFKIAYVANQQLEVGFAAVAFYSEQNFEDASGNTFDMGGVYAGLHLEPILFGGSKLNLSFPLLIGPGAVANADDLKRDIDIDLDNGDDWDAVFVVEPGINLLYNPSRFIQLEAGIRYRFSSKVELNPQTVNNINGFSAGVGVKLGIFNMGRNRYKKQLD